MKIKTEQEIKSASLERFPLSPIAPTNDLRFGFVTGYSQAQSDLLESASEGFEEFCTKEELSRYNEAYEKVWQEAKLSDAKIIREKDERIKELENELRNFERAELIQSNREDVLPAIQEATHYNWLDDQVHEKDQIIFNLESNYQEAVKDIETILALIDEGCLVYDQHVPSGSSSFRSDAECERLKLKSKYGLDKQESKR